jgi:hypothetical protein
VAAACEHAVANGRVLVAKLLELRSSWVERVSSRRDSAVWPLMDLVLRHPVLNTAVVQAELGISHTNAIKAIGRLVEAGALTEVGGRRRSILWQSSAVVGSARRARRVRRSGVAAPATTAVGVCTDPLWTGALRVPEANLLVAGARIGSDA